MIQVILRKKSKEGRKTGKGENPHLPRVIIVEPLFKTQLRPQRQVFLIPMKKFSIEK